MWRDRTDRKNMGRQAEIGWIISWYLGRQVGRQAGRVGWGRVG